MSFNSKESVKQWNQRCNNLPAEPYTNEYWDSLKNQAARLQEEVDELCKAIDLRDRYETLDAQVDIQVVLDGFIFLSQHNHDAAMQKVCGNNNLKYKTNIVDANAMAKAIAKTGVDINVQRYDDEHGITFYSVHRDSDNKIMKAVDHPKVDISDCVCNAEASIMVVTKPGCVICDGLIRNMKDVLKIKNLEVLEPFSSQADNEFCLENHLFSGDIVYYNGVGLQHTSYPAQGFDINNVHHWLKSVGAV